MSPSHPYECNLCKRIRYGVLDTAVILDLFAKFGPTVVRRTDIVVSHFVRNHASSVTVSTVDGINFDPDLVAQIITASSRIVRYCNNQVLSAEALGPRVTISNTLYWPVQTAEDPITNFKPNTDAITC
jgi:hypothetical protein